jgi:hypothetical protein
MDMMDFLNMNIYSSSIMTDKLLSPLVKKNSRHYLYIKDSVFVDNGCKSYKIIIKPKI